MQTTPTPTIKRLTITDMRHVEALQAVVGTLPPGFLRSKTNAEVCGHLDGTNGVAYGVFEGPRSRCSCFAPSVVRSGANICSPGGMRESCPSMMPPTVTSAGTSGSRYERTSIITTSASLPHRKLR